MKRILIYVVVILLFGFMYFESCQRNNYIEFADAPYVKIGENIIKVEIADEIDERILGLSFRESLEKDSGMLFVFNEKEERIFWMKDMQIALDVIWIVDSKIVKIDENCEPGGELPEVKYSSGVPVDLVLEVNGGLVEKYRIKVNDEVEVFSQI